MKPTKGATITGKLHGYTCLMNATADGTMVTVTGFGATREEAINDAISDELIAGRRRLTIKDMKIQLMEATYTVPLTDVLSLMNCDIGGWKPVKEECE